MTLIKGSKGFAFWEANSFKHVLFPPDDAVGRPREVSKQSYSGQLLYLLLPDFSMRSVRLRDVVDDNSHRTSEIFGLAFPRMPLPRMVQGTDGKRMQPSLDEHYATTADTEQMRTPHMETRHLLSLLLAIVRNPGQRPESRVRKHRAAVLLKDFLNSAARGRNLPGVAALVVGGCALPLQHGRLAVSGSPFEACEQWGSLKQWWDAVLVRAIPLPLETQDFLENHAVRFFMKDVPIVAIGFLWKQL